MPPIWLILGIGAGVAAGGFILSKIIPWIIRSIQYRNRISKEQYEKNLAMIKENSKERAIKKEKKQAKKAERKAKRQEIKKAIIKKGKEELKIAKEFVKFVRDTGIIGLALGISTGATAVYAIADIKESITEKNKLNKEKREIANTLKSKINHNKEPLKLASETPEYDLSIIEAKVDEITALQQKQKLSRTEAKRLKILQKETGSFFRHNKGYEMALINKKVQGQNQTQTSQAVPPPAPSNDRTRQL